MNRDEYRDFFNKNRKKVGYPQLTEEQLDRLIELSEKKKMGAYLLEERNQESKENE